jgi:site-specific DNA-methyltransferase (adenine-specific)
MFYACKVGPKERDWGCDALPGKGGAEITNRQEGSKGLSNGRAGAGRTSKDRKNHHPTVKPLSLMRYMVRGFCPPQGFVIDPLCGSGTTACAAVMEERKILAIEREPEYVEIARARLAHAYSLRRQE